jgi:phenylacetate-CoA ligase
MIDGYRSVAYDLCKFVKSRNRYPGIRPVWSGSELVYPHQPQITEERFCGRVMDHYGVGERAAFATECHVRNLHVNTSYS